MKEASRNLQGRLTWPGLGIVHGTSTALWILPPVRSVLDFSSLLPTNHTYSRMKRQQGRRRKPSAATRSKVRARDGSGWPKVTEYGRQTAIQRCCGTAQSWQTGSSICIYYCGTQNPGKDIRHTLVVSAGHEITIRRCRTLLLSIAGDGPSRQGKETKESSRLHATQATRSLAPCETR
ncbi:hypothetical protein K432DRAFT_74783 [Lepidopterella palustris CBS 459.81]|uniref:Uncharacterized protein n=1 Tax=Lepidopterella palustris CBS 459.81 TaxID=1314670 RepID=A0A8E2JE76_9PEZI|nr:hypothetical protein K432DRAFT_74783 [Lepidopterella palustris CBS 459.81]